MQFENCRKKYGMLYTKEKKTNKRKSRLKTKKGRIGGTKLEKVQKKMACLYTHTKEKINKRKSRLKRKKARMGGTKLGKLQKVTWHAVHKRKENKQTKIQTEKKERMNTSLKYIEVQTGLNGVLAH